MKAVKVSEVQENLHRGYVLISVNNGAGFEGCYFSGSEILEIVGILEYMLKIANIQNHEVIFFRPEVSKMNYGFSMPTGLRINQTWYTDVQDLLALQEVFLEAKQKL